MSPTFRVRSTHPEDLACGQMVGPGEETKNVNPKHPHDKNLIGEGKLIELPAKTRKKEQ